MIVRPVLCRPFVGRREELAYLHERRLEAGTSRGGFVFVAGNAGLGKSRILREFCTSLLNSRWRVARGACTQVAGRPYGPVLDALAKLDAGEAELAPAASRKEQIDALVARFAALAERKALLLVIEAVHWADVATLDFLVDISARLYNMRMLVVASYRPDELHAGSPLAEAVAKIAREGRTGTVALAPLAGFELRTFIDEALTGMTLPDTTRNAVARAGEGNPFFTEELLKSAVEHDDPGNGGNVRALPQTVRTTLLERFNAFDPDQRRVVAHAAVIGRNFHLDLLTSTVGLDAQHVLPVLRHARDVQIVEELAPRLFRFRHGLTRDAIYGDFLASELPPLHRTGALALESAAESDRSIEQLAYHSWAAGDAERSVRYNTLAGDAASRVHAHEDAIAFYERALEADAIEPLVRASLLEKIAERRIALTWSEDAQATYAAAADVYRGAGAFEREAGCRVHAAILAYTTALPAPTAPLEAMLERLDETEYLARSRVHLGLAWLAATFGFPTEAASHLAHVDARAREEAPDIGLRTHNVAAWVEMTIGDVAAFQPHFANWVDAARERGSPRALASAHVNGPMCFSFFGMHDEALENIAHAERIARETHNPYLQENCHAFAALCHLARGDLRRVRASIAHVPEATENHVNFTFAAGWGTIAAVHLDDRELIEKWFEGAEALGTRKIEIECGAGFAELLVRGGQHDEAAALLHRVLPECEMIRGNILTLLAVGKYGKGDDRRRARAYLARAAEGPVELPERPALRLFDAMECRRENRTAEAVVLARDAAEGFRRLRMPLLEATAREAAGEIDVALALYRRCGASHDVKRLGDAPPADARSADIPESLGELLSPREGEIAGLAGRGHTNLEIASKLSISQRTVEKHLASTFEKLG
ncbi:MAG: AAA family ATPase, partial [Candidatus Eremiobacteraeota bacterium]|nr:AAA family ATPase [Candidatus Eremiobacteraeota bacterium]